MGGEIRPKIQFELPPFLSALQLRTGDSFHIEFGYLMLGLILYLGKCFVVAETI